MRTLRALTLQLTLLLAGVVSSRTSTPKITPSTVETDFQLASTSVSITKVHPSLGDTSLLRTTSFVSTPRLPSSPSTTHFQTATFVAPTETSTPSSGATDWGVANFPASALKFSPLSRTTEIQICSTPKNPPGIAGSGYVPGKNSAAGNPLPLLAKILIPVAGVLLIVLASFTWYCCIRKKERGVDDLVLESTVMVRFESEDPHLSS